MGQARVCAGALCGDLPERYVAPIPHTSLKVTGVDVFSAGVLERVTTATRSSPCATPAAANTRSSLCATDVSRRDSLREITDGPWFVELMESKRDMAHFATA